MNLPAGNNSTSKNDDSSDSTYVVVIGGMNIDIHGSPASKLHLKDSNPGTVLTSPGGVARNIAENLARLGADCRLISTVGNDQHGRLLLEQGSTAGINMQHVVQLDSEQTSTYLSVIDETGDMYVAISDMAIIDRLGPAQLQTHDQLLKQAALVVIDTNLNDNAIAWLAGNTANQPLFVDTVSTAKAIKIKAHLSAVHTLKTNLIEAKAIASILIDTNNDLPKIANWFHEQGVERLFVTLSERGVFASDGSEYRIYTPSNGKSDPINAGGAGDAFMAGLAYSWLNEWNLARTVGFAMAAASVALSNWRTSNPELSLELVTRVYESCYAD